MSAAFAELEGYGVGHLDGRCSGFDAQHLPGDAGKMAKRAPAGSAVRHARYCLLSLLRVIEGDVLQPAHSRQVQSTLIETVAGSVAETERRMQKAPDDYRRFSKQASVALVGSYQRRSPHS